MGGLVQIVSGFGFHDEFLIHDHVQSLFPKLVTSVKHPHG
jgi:hypothetical protein